MARVIADGIHGVVTIHRGPHRALQIHLWAEREDIRPHDIFKSQVWIAEHEVTLAQSRAQRTGHTRFGPQRLLGPAPGARDVSLRASLLCAENRWGEALQLVQPPAYCSEQVLEHIALHLGIAQWDQAVALLQRVLTSTMLRATSPYRRELDLVRKILARMSDDTTRRHWLSGLVSVHKAKRNFVRDLPVV